MRTGFVFIFIWRLSQGVHHSARDPSQQSMANQDRSSVQEPEGKELLGVFGARNYQNIPEVCV